MVEGSHVNVFVDYFSTPPSIHFNNFILGSPKLQIIIRNIALPLVYTEIGSIKHRNAHSFIYSGMRKVLCKPGTSYIENLFKKNMKNLPFTLTMLLHQF